jgi:hypothetical protein
MNWYGKECLNPTRTKQLVKKWQAPPGNVHDAYYDKFPELYPYYLPDDHHKVKYNEAHYPKHRDYRTFKRAPPEIKSKHIIEWEDGYGPCNVCDECVTAANLNTIQNKMYYRRLQEWRDKGTPM